MISLDDRSSVQVSVEGGGQPQWAQDGSELYFWRDNRVIAVSVELDPVFRSFGGERVLFDFPDRKVGAHYFDVSPNGREFAFYRLDEWARFMLITNWFDELTEKVGK